MDLEYLRAQYEKAASDKQICELMIAELINHADSPVQLAYLGGCQAIWANHTNGILSKLNTFNRGKKNIDQAVRANADNVDIRMIRLSVQQNCPSFLNYNDHIIQDRQYLEQHKSKVRSLVLLRIINSLLIQ